MTAAEYNELIDLLSRGHELEFSYDGMTYYLEFVGDSAYEFYDITNEGNGIFIGSIRGKDMRDLVARFMKAPLICGRSFGELYPFIRSVNID